MCGVVDRGKIRPMSTCGRELGVSSTYLTSFPFRALPHQCAHKAILDLSTCLFDFQWILSTHVCEFQKDGRQRLTSVLYDAAQSEKDENSHRCLTRDTSYAYRRRVSDGCVVFTLCTVVGNRKCVDTFREHITTTYRLDRY